MSSFEREVAAQRAALQRIDAQAAANVVRSYSAVRTRLKARMRQLAAQIDQARAAGTEVRPGWLFAQERYQRLIGELEDATLAFLARARGTITDAQGAAVERAEFHGLRVTVSALGPGPVSAQEQVRAGFQRLPVGALERIVGNAGDGKPLGLLLGEVAPVGPEAVRDALAFGVATGRSTRLIARDVAQKGNVPLGRALGISRTEVTRAFREASQETYRSTGIVREWVWVASVGGRTCPVCLAMHGTRHPIDEPQSSHPMCRCTQAAVTPSWRELGFHGIPDRRPTVTPGPDLFARMSEAQQRSILGPTKFEAYQSGQLALPDLVRRTTSARWGAGLREATVSEAIA